MKNNTLASLTWLRLIRFANQNNQLSNEFLKRFKLTSAQFDVLVQIQVYQPLTQTELAQRVTVTQGGISRMLSRLEKEGYVMRTQEWKQKTISLSLKGSQVLEKAMPEQLDFQTSLFEDTLTKEELKNLYTMLTRLYKNNERKKLPPE